MAGYSIGITEPKYMDILESEFDDNADTIQKERGLITAFAVAHPNESNIDIFWELSTSCEILFADQSKTLKYAALMNKLKSLSSEARSLAGLEGGVNTKERLEKRNSYEKALIELMESYIPLMLDDEDFFRKAFPIR